MENENVGLKVGGTNIPLPPIKNVGGTCPPCPPPPAASYASVMCLFSYASVMCLLSLSITHILLFTTNTFIATYSLSLVVHFQCCTTRARARNTHTHTHTQQGTMPPSPNSKAGLPYKMPIYNINGKCPLPPPPPPFVSISMQTELI